MTSNNSLTVSPVTDEKEIGLLAALSFRADYERGIVKPYPQHCILRDEESLLTHHFRRNTTLLKIEDADKNLLGFLSYKSEGDTIRSERFCTLPCEGDHESELLRHFLQEAKGKSAKKIVLVAGHDRAQELCSEQGFEKTRTRYMEMNLA